jgi:GABA permease
VIGVRRYLVVANQTLGSQRLRDRIQAAMAEGPSHFHLVVPASHPSGAWSEGEARALAGRRLDRALVSFRELGADVSGEVGDASPIRAVSDVLMEEQYDEIFLSTLPPGPSRWLRQDVVHRIQRTFALPCTHVVAEAEPAGMPG